MQLPHLKDGRHVRRHDPDPLVVELLDIALAKDVPAEVAATAVARRAAGDVMLVSRALHQSIRASHMAPTPAVLRAMAVLTMALRLAESADASPVAQTCP